MRLNLWESREIIPKQTCYFDRERDCTNNGQCMECENNPPGEEKLNGRNPAVRMAWETGPHDSGQWPMWPMCPACGEMPYDLECCFWCGQRFIQDDPLLQEYARPPEEERTDCFVCGGKNTMVGYRAKGNGHFHGSCEACGCRVIE